MARRKMAGKKTAAKIQAKPPGSVRCISAIFTHMHNVRCKWIRLTAPHLAVPLQLNRARCTPQQASAGLAGSTARCCEMLSEALGEDRSRAKKFLRDGWAKPLASRPGDVVLHACPKPTIAAKCSCSLTNSDSRCRKK